MKKANLKLATLNLHGFTDWEERLPLIVDLIKKIDPDILLLQEVQQDLSRDKDDQATMIKNAAGYPHAHFEVACIKTTHKGSPLPNPIDHGLGIISKLPFKAEAISLAQAGGGLEHRILLKGVFETSGGTVTIADAHFANDDVWAAAHLKEALEIFSSKGIETVLAGDFNIKDLGAYRKLYEKRYIASSDKYDYVSYPEDGLSYDYMLIPNTYSFIGFQCREEAVSDHKLLFAEIEWE